MPKTVKLRENSEVKKSLLILALLVFVAGSANANIYVSWIASAGFYFPGAPSVGILSPGESTIAQLIFSTDSTIGGVDINNAGNGYVSGNDLLLASVTLTEGSSGIDQWAFFNASPSTLFNGAYSAGYIYGRIFEDNTPALNERYYNGTTAVALDRNPLAEPPDSPQGYEFNTDLQNGNALDQVIPEPGSFGLFALGMLTVGAYRKLKRKAA